MSVRTRLHRAFEFFNIFEDDKPRLSLTKLGLWGAMIANAVNTFGQLGDQIRAWLTNTPSHPSIPLLVATNVAHALAAAKSEMKRHTVTP